MNLVPEAASTAAHVERLRAHVEEALARLVPESDPAQLYDPVRYVLSGGGKRVRPVMLLLAAEIFGADAERALPGALAVEVFHNFTLVHDDIMDHADARRGRPTVHVRWDESTAILAGDYMMGLSYDLLARLETDRLAAIVRRFQRMVARLCEGQALDTAFERRRDVSVEEYLGMIDGKTGALLGAALELGGLIGGAGPAHRRLLDDLGGHVGRAFQIQDDLLDLVADHEEWGKQIGGDLIEGKKTFLLLRALERTEGADRAWFARIVDEGGLAPEAVEEARDRMAEAGVLEEARAAVDRHSAAALAALDRLPGAPARETLRWMIDRMRRRLH